MVTPRKTKINTRKDRKKEHTTNQVVNYESLTPSLSLQLAAPHTWVSAIIPVLVSAAYVGVTYSGKINIVVLLVLLAISILMQSSVNTLNDYFDFKKGTDSLDNSSEDSFDAVLVYHHLKPHHVLCLGIGYLAAAFILGCYIISVSDFVPLIIGCIGAFAIVFYSGGKTPISYLPIGELVSGLVMGGLIPLACVYVLSGILDWFSLVVVLPTIIGIGMILATNNTCDIEKDIEAKRKTLSVVLGRKRAVFVYRCAIIGWLIITVGLVGILFTSGLPIMIFMLLCMFAVLRALLKNPLKQKSRDGAMSQIVTSNILVGTFYSLAIVVSSCITWIA